MGKTMKSKPPLHVQPREVVHRHARRAAEEIRNFLRAAESYPARVAEKPGLTFQQHVANLYPAHCFRTRRVDR